MELRRFLLIITATLLIALILTAWFFPSNADFRVDNPFWNGIGDLKDHYQVQPLDSLADLASSADGATLFVVPYLSCTPGELEHLNQFVDRGGDLILADDYGHGNQILEYLGLEARFSGQILLDPLINYKNKHFPRITNVRPDPLTVNTDNLVFNHATSLTNITGDNILALSSFFSFLDYNGDGIQDSDEPTGPLPVISRHGLGRGQVILISDPSLFINGMDNIASNDRFIHNIAANTPVLYIDQSLLASSELHRTKSWLQQVRSLLCTPPVTAALVSAAVILALLPVWQKKRKVTDDT